MNFYVKTFYGDTDIYEFNLNDYNINLLNEKNFTLLTKPMKSYEKENLISNKIHYFENNNILSLNLAPHSLFDIYLEIEDNSTVINLLPKTINIFDNGAKYLKKDIEYTLNFTSNHLFKLEPGFDSIVKIYNDTNNVILNSSNPTAAFFGDKIKIISNNDTIIYFYSRS